MGACPGTHPAPTGTAEEGLVTRGPTLTVGILAAADEGCQARRNRGLTCGGGSVMLGVSPGPGPSSGPGWLEAAPGGRGPSTSLRWLGSRSPLQPLAVGTYLYPREVLRLPAIKDQPGDPRASACHCSGRETEAQRQECRNPMALVAARAVCGEDNARSWAFSFLFSGPWPGAVTQGHSWESDPGWSLGRLGS